MSPTNQTIFDVGSIANYRQVLGEAVNLKSTNRRFEVPNYAVASYEHALKKLSHFDPKWEVECDGTYIKPLNSKSLMLQIYIR